MEKKIYIIPEIDMVAALMQDHLLQESKHGVYNPTTGTFEEGIEFINGAGTDGVDPSTIGDVDAKKGSNMWDGWDD